MVMAPRTLYQAPLQNSGVDRGLGIESEVFWLIPAFYQTVCLCVCQNACSMLGTVLDAEDCLPNLFHKHLFSVMA